LVESKQRGLIAQVKPMMDDLRDGGTRIAQPLYERVLQLDQEI
jgi:predicted nucleic acid-binding protein